MQRKNNILKGVMVLTALYATETWNMKTSEAAECNGDKVSDEYVWSDRKKEVRGRIN